MGDIPQAITIIVKSIKGAHAVIIWLVVYLCATMMVGGGSLTNLQVFFGFQNLKKIIRLTIEPTPAMMSGRAGPRKFEQNHCKKANEMPDTNIAGNTSIDFLKPHINTTR